MGWERIRINDIGNDFGGFDSPATATCETGIAATVLHNHLTIGFGERLSSQGHHVGHGVEVDGLEFVRNLPANVAKFDRNLAVNLPLHGQVKLLIHTRPEFGINSFTRPRGYRIESGKIRLR